MDHRVKPDGDDVRGACANNSRRSCERAVDHVDGVLNAVGGDERAEARAFLLAEQHLIEHVEPVERHAGLAVLGLLLLIEEGFAAADLIDHILDGLRVGVGPQLRQRIAQVDERGTLGIARLAEFLRRQHEVAEVMNGIIDELDEMRMGRAA